MTQNSWSEMWLSAFEFGVGQLCSMKNRDEITGLVSEEKLYPAWVWCRRKSHPVESEKSPKRNQKQARLTTELSTWSLFPVLISRGGSRGRVRGVRPPPASLEMTCAFLIQLVFCKKKTMWFIGVEEEQETSAPSPKKNTGSAPDLWAPCGVCIMTSPSAIPFHFVDITKRSAVPLDFFPNQNTSTWNTEWSRKRSSHRQATSELHFH